MLFKKWNLCHENIHFTLNDTFHVLIHFNLDAYIWKLIKRAPVFLDAH